MRTAPLLLIAMCLPLHAEQYVIRAGESRPDIGWTTYWSGVVDTQENTLSLTEFLTSDGSGWKSVLPESSSPWPALQPGPGGEPLPYDIPDAWNGKVSGWGFISPPGLLDLGTAYRLTKEGPLDTGNEVQPGFGCVLESGNQLQCDSITPRGRSAMQFLAMWPNEGGIYGVDSDGSAIQQLWGQGLAAYGSYTFKSAFAPEPRLVGDVNSDRVFDSNDLVSVMQQGRYETGVKGATWEQGDWNHDLLFDSNDMVLAFQGGMYEQPAGVVPEPSAIVLMIIGLLLLGCRR